MRERFALASAALPIANISGVKTEACAFDHGANENVVVAIAAFDEANKQ
jgi:hypothetical protein